MITTLFAQHFRSAQRYFRRERVARTITALAFVLVIAGLATLMYVLFSQGLAFIASFHESSSAVSLYMYELTLLTVMGLMFASALISGVTRLFHGSYDFWIMASPSFASLPWYVYINILLSSLWPLIIIGIPALCAIQNIFHIGISTFIIAFFALSVLAVFTVSSALALLLFVTWIISKNGSRHVVSALVAVIIGIFALGAFIFWHEIRGISDVANLFPGITAPTTDEVGTVKVVQQFLYFPSHPVAEVFFASEQHTVSHALFFFSIILLLAVIALGIFTILARAHLSLWQYIQEHIFEVASSHRTSRAFTFSSRNPIAVLFEKEALIFFRNKSGMLWLGFLGLVWLLQVGFDVILRRNAHTYTTDLHALPPSIQVLQLIVIVYFISMFVLRFVFPSFSVEKDTGWLIGSMPLSLVRVYAAKLFFYSALFIALSAAVVALHSLILGSTLMSSVSLFLLIAYMTGLIVLFGLSLGVLFPNFETIDPEQLSTSLSGLTFIVGSLTYGSFGAFAYRTFLTSGSITVLAVFIIASALSFGTLHILSIRTLRHFEFGT